MLWSRACKVPTYIVTSDASGSWGCGALHNTQWFQVEWSDQFKEEPIHFKELMPIIIASMVWGRQWSGQIVGFECDNMAVVEVLKSGYSRDKGMLHLLRTLFFVAARFNFWFTAIHLPGERNIAADLISRNKINELPLVAPYLSHPPYVIPQDILHLLYNGAPDWTSRAWAAQFNTCLRTP